MWSFDTYSWLLFFTAFLSLVISIDVHNKKFTSGKKPLVMLMTMIAFWALAGALENSLINMGEKVLFAKLEYIGARCTPLLFLLFVIGFTKYKKLDKYLFAFWIIPIILIFLAFTNQYHGLVWKSISWNVAYDHKLLYVNGYAYILASIYSLLLLLISMTLLIKSIQSTPEYFGKQLKQILLISSIPLIVTVIFVTRVIPVHWLDIRPMGYMISGLLLLIGINRFNLFSLTPIARDVLVERMQGCVLVLDKHRRIIDMNPAALKTFNLHDEWLWKKLEELFPSLDMLLSEPFDGKEKNVDLHMEVPINAWFDVSVSELKTQQHHIYGYLLILRNVTEKKMYEQALESFIAKLTISEEELRELNLQKNKLLSIIGHDLRNPFHQILGLSQVIAQADDTMDKAELIELGDLLHQAAQKGNNILKSLLDWSQLQAKGIQFNPETIDLNQIVTETISMVELLAQEKKISLAFESVGEYNAKIDKHMIIAVIRNLLTNAIKFSNANSTITLKVTGDDENFIICVEDQGVGIKPEDISRLFKIGEKYTVPGTSGEQGTGLGLSLCKEFVEKHKGSIRVESEINKGSSFIISLPVNPD